MPDTYTVRLEPVGLEFEVEEGETVLDAAFRNGVSLPHGCKVGQCASCKCHLVEGEVELLKYATLRLFTVNASKAISCCAGRCRRKIWSSQC